jgi:hypothetical protein
VAGQEIELKPRPPEPVTTRPLKTGAAFTLVLPRKRFIYRHWDKEKYLPGEVAQLILEGEGIGEGPYEFRIETSGDDGQGKSWRQVATIKATVEGDKASAKFKLPKTPPRGRITKAEWRRTFAKPGDRIGLHVEAEGYEGAPLGIRVERKNPQTGEWETYARWRGEIEDGKYEGVFPAPPVKSKRPGVAGEIVALRWIDKPQENAPVWMEATVRKLDGTPLEIFLERSDAKGNWVQIGKAISTVRDGVAKNVVLVPPLPEEAPPAPSPVHFSKCAFHGGEDLVVSVDPNWLQDKAFEVKLERRELQQGSPWEEIAQVKGRRGKAEE